LSEKGKQKKVVNAFLMRELYRVKEASSFESRDCRRHLMGRDKGRGGQEALFREKDRGTLSGGNGSGRQVRDLISIQAKYLQIKQHFK